MTPSDLRDSLRKCGYAKHLILPGEAVGNGADRSIVGYAQFPADLRSACISVIEAGSSASASVGTQRPLGAPLAFVCDGDFLHWWKQGTHSAERIETIERTHIDNFFDSHAEDFAPAAVYRAKTWGRFQAEYQLSFVDVGLLPMLEAEIGASVGDLIERVIGDMKTDLRWDDVSSEQGHWLIQSVFWLVSGKMLRDKGVEAFKGLSPSHGVHAILNLVAKHHGAGPMSMPQQRLAALERAAETVMQFTSLEPTTTEALAHVYENTLISDATRSSLGTHSTPSYLVDYVVGNLTEWISEIPESERKVFEPACGHAAFLVSAMRLLAELLPAEKQTPPGRRSYLRNRIKGLEIDGFALELARLSLTLTDIPNPDGWNLVNGDMFTQSRLEHGVSDCTILLANPPFENFTKEEKCRYEDRPPECLNKAAETAWRTLPLLPVGGVFGLVLPQSFLGSRSARPVRELLVREFEIKEIALFPDKVFSFSDVETAVLVGRRGKPTSRSSVRYRRVRENEMARFRSDYLVGSDRTVPQADFLLSGTVDLRVPELASVWGHLDGGLRLVDVADLGQGLAFKSEGSLPAGAPTYSQQWLPGTHAGFVRFERDVQTHLLPPVHWLNLDEEVIRRPLLGTTTGIAQVLLNYAPASRGPWRLRALLDERGHAVTSRFVPVRPTDRRFGLAALWAVLNSPVANAYVFAHLGKRDNLVGELRRMPMPEPEALREVERFAVEYLAEAIAPGSEAALRDRMIALDVQVLQAYGLPRDLERELLDVFAGQRRIGVPFEQIGYLPDDVRQEVSLSEFRKYASDWAGTNRLRGSLIDKEIDGSLSADEADLLRSLQAYAEYHLRGSAPRPTAVLEKLERIAFGASTSE